MSNSIRLRAKITGIVQGVGFRPFVYRIALREGIVGFVRNETAGVVIEAQGEKTAVTTFINALSKEAPPLASVRSIQTEEIDLTDADRFHIPPSQKGEGGEVVIPADAATCQNCLGELDNPEDRRFRYPFINCTDCGPRYTIIEKVPYDRPYTTMREFLMCPDCLREYQEPADRRFHAQPIACSTCGPQIELLDKTGQKIICDDPIHQTVRLLAQGKIGALKGLGGFHLACDAQNETAVRELRHRKRRPHKPFAVMAKNLAAVSKFSVVDEVEKKLLTNWRRSIVLLRARSPNLLAREVGGSSNWIGTMLPYTPLHYLLFTEQYHALVMTSANLTDEPIAYQNQEALERLSSIADFFLIHNRDILIRTDDSVTRALGEELCIMRRSRGFVPEPIFLPQEFETIPPVLAVGGDLKNTCCMTKDAQAFMGQHIGDLKHPDALDFLTSNINHIQTLINCEPELVVHDLHPDYHSTRLAHTFEGVDRFAIQHHHAHGLSCLIEHGWTKPALVLSFDGAGYGTDGQIWGGEFLQVDGLTCHRLAHFKYLPLPGGDRAAKEPWRMAISAITSACGLKGINLFSQLKPIAEIDQQLVKQVAQLAQQHDLCPQTSSVGRLFDAAASILGLRQIMSYEGQAAMELEQLAEAVESAMPFEYQLVNALEDSLPLQIDLTPMWPVFIEQVLSHRQQNYLARAFHETIAAAITDVMQILQKQTGLTTVALSGGVWQNRILYQLVTEKLTGSGFKVLTQQKVPPNDGGLSLGQAWAGILYLGRLMPRHHAG